MRRLLFLISIFLLSAAQADGLEITFRQSAAVTSKYITLADIATFDETTQLTKSLGTQVVTQSPAPGESKLINSLAVKKYILRTTPLSRYTGWSGSRVVTVTRAGQRITPQRVLGSIDDYLQKNKHSLPDAEISFTPRSRPLPFMLPDGKLAIEVIPSNPDIIGSSRFSLIFRVDGKVRKNFSVIGDLKVLAPVVIATDSLKRGATLTPANTKMALKDLSRYDNPCTDLRRILGKRLKRSIRVHNVIHSSDVEIPPLVRRGQLVKIILNIKNLHISATGIARMNGGQGDIIRVRNASSNKLIHARVTAPGTVEVII